MIFNFNELFNEKETPPVKFALPMATTSTKTNQTSFQDIRYSHNPNLRPIISLKPSWKTTFTYSPTSTDVAEAIKTCVSGLLIEANNGTITEFTYGIHLVYELRKIVEDD